MIIESYKITESTVQANGKQRVRVAFIDHLGKVHNRGYEFPAEAIVGDEIKIRKGHVEDGLISAEVEKLVSAMENGESVGTFKYCLIEDVKVALLMKKTENLIEITNLTNKNTYLELESK